MWTSRIKEADKMALLAWEKETGIKLVQINGQRLYGGPPPGWVGGPPLANTEVYIGRLPQDVYENTLIPLFESVGKLYEFRLMLTFSGFNRGFAYARYASLRGARRAIATFHCFQLREGCAIMVCWSKQKHKLVVNDLPALVSQQELEARLQMVTEGICGVSLHASPCQRQTRLPVLKYRLDKAATLAKKALMGEPLDHLDPNCETATVFSSAKPTADLVLVNSATVSTPIDAYTAPATGLSSNSAASTPASVITAAPQQTAVQPVSPFPAGRRAVSSVPFPIYSAPLPPVSEAAKANAVLPAYSWDASGSHLTQDANVLWYYFNLGLQYCRQHGWPPRMYVLPVLPSSPVEVYPVYAEPAPVLDQSLPQLFSDAGQAQVHRFPLEASANGNFQNTEPPPLSYGPVVSDPFSHLQPAASARL